MIRPNPKIMSDAHLLDEYLNVYSDNGSRHLALRTELESRLLERKVLLESEGGKKLIQLYNEIDRLFAR